jgi:hypothetical protein
LNGRSAAGLENGEMGQAIDWVTILGKIFQLGVIDCCDFLTHLAQRQRAFWPLSRAQLTAAGWP